ncbi:hypothetical protein [Lentibacillus cibarius]|uniref:Uncharacterized protein n=1 Tax=Lentibacillus cibarius TaxID=2583219 RepID=A0A5S3QJG9_9BACI|nr:hypothetical protein [Lentibacillus cibarius]TMN21877.1 hypothetical protein FFL34_06930 [Lentibacillus cibarius]
MKQYYMVRTSDEKDEELGVVDALSLEEAHAIAKVRYQGKMNSGESLHVFQANEPLTFDAKNRFVFPAGEMMSVTRF